MIDHELRQSLNDELHGRTGLRISAPARITHLAFTIGEGDASPLLHLTELALQLGVDVPEENALHHHLKIAGGYLRFERHGEFYRIAIIVEGKQPAGAVAMDLVPFEWMEGLPGKRLVAIHTHLLSAKEKTPDDAALLTLFGHDDLAASTVAQGGAMVWTDFRIRPDGFSRWLVQDKGLTPLRLGRVIRRIHEIETYRMMSLLALPLARTAQTELRPLEQNLHDVIGRMTEDEAENDATLLARLSAVARQVEELSNRTNYRFAATRAYAALVEKRVAELHESRIRNYQRIGIFLDRRFSPAIATCNAVMRRIESLAQRAERANNLLRTRVDIALEAQNQSLLRSMDSRAKQQLVLQETVEGLSVVAISYYLFNLLAKFAEGFQGEQTPLERLLHLAGVPLAVLLVWLGLQIIRRRNRR
jgi:uncharacterized membrane-anchored protein